MAVFDPTLSHKVGPIGL